MSWRTTVGRRAAERNAAGELPKRTRQEGCRKNTGRKADRELPKKFRQIADGEIPAGELPKKPRQEAAKIVSAESYRENTGKKADGNRPAESCGINFGRTTCLPEHIPAGGTTRLAGPQSARLPGNKSARTHTGRQSGNIVWQIYCRQTVSSRRSDGQRTVRRLTSSEPSEAPDEHLAGSLAFSSA